MGRAMTPPAAAVPSTAAVAKHRPSRLPSLQVLRFLAAFLVVLFHAGAGLQIEFGLSSNLFYYGASGVDVFFVLSGFIIAYTSDASRGVFYFLKRRVARIVPLYWFLTAGVIAIALVMPQLLNSTVVNAETVWKSFLFIPYQKDSGLVQPILFLGWTLCYEMYFYLVFAGALMAGRQTPWVVCAVISLVVLFGAAWPEGPVLWRFYSDPITLEFLYGVLLHQVFLRWPLLRQGSLPLAAALCGLGLALYVAGVGLPRFLGQGVPAAILVVGFLCLRLPEGRTVALLVLLGDASYSLYLSHPYVLQLPIKLLGASHGLALATLASAAFVGVAVLASLALFFCIEKPAQRLVLSSFGVSPRRPARAEA
jgi:peptidoglycan/LPS O-acetylase OafA/YrhL